MILRYIDVCLKPVEYQDICSDFLFRSRYLGNFLGRRLKPLKFNAEGFNAILVEGRATLPGPCAIHEVNALIAPVRFDRKRYEALGPNEHHEFFISMLSEGLEKCVPDFKIPIAEIREGIEDFRRGGYKNEWTHQSKLLRPLGVRASLLCKMDSERFVLTLVLERNGKTIFNEPILEEAPDEICFGYQFKDITVKESTLIITSKISKPLLTLDLHPLLAKQ